MKCKLTRLKKFTFGFFTSISLTFSTAWADKTMEDYSREASVFFDVQKTSTGLTLIGKEAGAETFRTTISNSSFGSFAGFNGGNFQVQRLQDFLHWSYKSATSEEFYEITVSQNGNISLSELPQNYTGFDHYRMYAFRTSGILENHGSQAFYNLVLSANQFHNFGTIQTETYHFFHNYSFNSGVIKAGYTPTGVANLHDGMAITAVPHFQNGVIDNYGKHTVNGKLEIHDGLNYHNYCESNMENLKMFDGNVRVLDGNMNISGKLSGTVRDVEISNNSALYVKDFEAKQTGNLITRSGGMLYTSPLDKTRLEREINEAVDERISVLPEATKRRYQRSYTDWRIPAALDAGTGLQGGGGVASVVGGLVVGGVVSAVSGHHHGGGGGRIHVGVNQDGHVFAGPSRESLHYQSRRRRNQDLHFERQMQDSMNGSHLAHTAPAIFNSPLARDTSRLREALQRSKAYTSTNDYLPRHKNKAWPELQLLNAFVKTPLSPAYRDNRSYFSKLRTALLTAHIPQNDIRNIWSDVWLRTANEWGSYPLQKQLDLIHEDYHIYDLSQQIEKEREEFRRIMDRALNNPIDRFIDNFMIPVTVFAAQQSPYGRVAMAFATTARAVAPKLGQIATSIGATAAFQRYSTFLSQKASGGDPKPRAGSREPAPRVQSTKADLDNFIQSKLDSGICSKWKVVDGRQTYRFSRNDGLFKKGDLITKDTRHYEAEWWNSSGIHKGAIEPVKGTQYKGPDPTKHLNLN